MSYREVFVGLDDENINKLAEDFVETQPVAPQLKFCKALNPDYIKKQFKKRQHKYNKEIERERKKRGKLVWLSKMPFSYFRTHGNWGDSKFTYERSKHGYIFTLRPGYELVEDYSD